MSEVHEKGALAKQASYMMNEKTSEEKNNALRLIAEQLKRDTVEIIDANNEDMTLGAQVGLSQSVLDRILLTAERIEAMHDSILQLIELEDPVGEVLETIDKENGLHIEKRRVPLGVIAMIYEARPNVTVDAATLALKTGNAVILRGSSSAKHSNIAIVNSIHRALEQSTLPIDAIQLIEDTSRETASDLFHLTEYLDVLIPRGGKKFIEMVIREASVPVLETGAGNCHIYIDEDAELSMVERIVENAKLQRPSVCNAAESLLIHKDWFTHYGHTLMEFLLAKNITIHGDELVSAVAPDRILKATEEDWGTEYLEAELSVKIVATLDEAIRHINTYGTKHSEAIITPHKERATRFQRMVDAAAVYHNASTRFTDGFEFGYGAEIGISTQKLHARGPMGLPALTSTKVWIEGTGQIRS
ncbi:glutamate-5-semialdehyde dehydrogenase [Kurthia senegalensis]|uniref:glutamate-5-semialdehyde dehydrogenase n=1 Tax=Kurthia senegalensis TaxID=1033740 RepID=UPI000288CEF8|nr:glutamate-5-semialdehyde dehydrogenase [Kurthia senegalensis]